MGLKIEVELSDTTMDTIAQKAAAIMQQNSDASKTVEDKDEIYYTVNQVESMLNNIVASTIRRHCRLGILTGKKVGKGYLISKSNLQIYLEKNGK